MLAIGIVFFLASDNEIIYRFRRDFLGGYYGYEIMDKAKSVFYRVLTGPQFFGKSVYFDKLISANPESSLYDLRWVWMNDLPVLTLLRFGKVAFAAILLLSFAFLFCIFKMAFKANKSGFSKYTSRMIAFYLAGKTIAAIGSLFLTGEMITRLPFLGSGTQDLYSYICFGIILVLYLERENPTTVREIGEHTLKVLNLEWNSKEMKLELLDRINDRDILYYVASPLNEAREKVIILQTSREENGKEYYLRVGRPVYDRVYDLFRERNADKYNFID